MGTMPRSKYKGKTVAFFLKLNMCLINLFSLFISFVSGFPVMVSADSPDVNEGLMKVLCSFVE